MQLNANWLKAGTAVLTILMFTSCDALDDGGSSDNDSKKDAIAEVLDLGEASGFVMLAKSAITDDPTSDVTGDVGLSPAAASYITGFSLILDTTSGEFSTSTQVTGKVFAADYAEPTPTILTAAIGDMETAFTNAAGLDPDVTELGEGDIGGMTLEPGVYSWSTGLLIPTDITLSGNETDVWIFQIAKGLTISDGVMVTLAGGALPQNIVWQVSEAVSLGTTAHIEGVVLCKTAITLKTGASANGRLMAQTAVTIAGSTLVAPAQ